MTVGRNSLITQKEGLGQKSAGHIDKQQKAAAAGQIEGQDRPLDGVSLCMCVCVFPPPTLAPLYKSIPYPSLPSLDPRPSVRHPRGRRRHHLHHRLYQTSKTS